MTDISPLKLMIMSGPEDGTVLVLDEPKHGDAYTLGRREDCDVILMYDNQVSRQHARLFARDDQWYLQDLDSRNGTFIDKQKIDKAMPLKPGQLFRLGRTWLRLQNSNDSATMGADED